jgi:hypothetical protein
LLGGERGQRRRLAGNGVLLLLLLRGYPGVDRRRLHRRSDQLAAPGLRRCRHADNPYAIGDEGPIDLFELGDEQTVKGIFETDVTLVPLLSHVHALPTETPIWRVVRFRSWQPADRGVGPQLPYHVARDLRVIVTEASATTGGDATA